MQDPRKHLQDLGLSDSEATIYLAMVSGVRTARDLVKVTRMKRPTVYYALNSLEKRGLTSKTGISGDKNFKLEPLSRLAVIAKEKTAEMEQLEGCVSAMIHSLSARTASESEKPAVAFYEGVDAVKNIIMEMLYCKEKSIDTIAPAENFFWQVGGEFVKRYIEERIKKKIHTRNIWEERIDSEILKEYYDKLSSVRIAPKVMRGKFETSIFLYDDKTLYVSSKKNAYCVLIKSKEHHATMKAMFEGLWVGSEEHGK